MVKNYLSKYPLWILMFLLLPLGASAQNCTVLSDFTAVCIGASQTYAAETSGGEAHTINSTNNYGCLGSSPNSRWFYFKVDTGGSLVINQTNSNLVDVDGAIWGPFDTLSDMTTSCGSYSTPLACDYATAAGFNFSLTVTTGKYYALLVSNFSGSATDITLADGGSTAVTDCSPDIQVTKAASGSTFNEGATVNWTLTAKNGGVNDGTNINITDVLPAGLSYVSHSGSGTYSSSTGVWAVGTLSANQTATLTITTTVNANTGPTTITNTITNVSLTETESNALPDTLSDSITINDPCNATASGNTDSDGDNISDACDLDDDNDGILDTDEGCSQNVTLTHDYAIGYFQDGGSNEVNIGGSGGIVSATNFYDGDGPGVNVTKQSISGATIHDVTGVNQSTFAAAQTDGDYMGSTLFTGSQTRTISRFTFPYLGSISQGTFTVAVVIYDPNSGTEHVLDSGIVVSSSNNGDFDMSNVFAMKANATYELRVYFYNASGNVRLDNPRVRTSVVSTTCIDTDGDSTPDYLDLDSDNDGCFDALEADENVTAAQLDGNGRINQASLGGVDANGVPNLVNSGGAADAGGDQGQGATGNEIVATQVVVDATALQNKSVIEGNSTNFTVTSVTATNTTTFTGTPPNTTPNYGAGSAAAASTYQWQEDGVNLSDGGVYSGTTSANLMISNVNGLDGKVYKLIVTHPNNECISIENSATLTVLTDSDGDNVADINDYDDDNDGILDIDERPCFAFSDNFGTGTGSPATSHPNVPAANVQNVRVGTNADFPGQSWYQPNSGADAAGETEGKYLALDNPQGVTPVLMYSETLTVQANEQYSYSLFAAAAREVSGQPLSNYPDVRMQIKDGMGTVLQTINTGAVSLNWTRYEFLFTSTTTSVTIEIYNNNAGSAYNTLLVDEIAISLISCDTDGDGTPDYLDTDSDNDGCLDAIEGNENVAAAQLDGNGRINIATQGGVDANGVPNLVNSGGAADAGGDQGQGLTGNEIVAASAQINTQPSTAVSICTADSGSISVGATSLTTTTFTGTAPARVPDYSGSTPSTTGLVYQWQVQTGGAGAWSNLTNTGIYSDVTTTSLTITNPTTGVSTNKYRVVITSTLNECISLTSGESTLTVNTTPTAPTASAQAFCSADSPTVADLVATGTGIQWYAASTGGTALAGTTALSTGTYYASQTVSSCESSRTSVSVTVNTTPTAPTASAQAFCSADSPTVADLVATGTGIQWYTALTGGTALAGTTALSTGTYYASQTVSSCESSRTSVSVTVNTTPSAPTASAQAFCSADSPTVADLVATGTGIQWYAASTGGTALAGTTALSTGTYYASQTVSSCESSRTSVSVTVNTTPSAPTASAQAFCSADSPTVADLVATGTGIQWYAASTGGTALAGTTALSTGTYYASQTVSSCESSRTSVSITVNTTPTAPTASAQAFCSADSPTVADLVATGTGIQWYAASTGGTALAGTTALSTGTYYASQTVSSCESSRTSVSITVNTTPTAPTASAQAFCSADSPTVADLVATGTGIQWYAASTGGTALAGTTALSTGTYYASQTVSSCESSRTSVSVTVNTTPTAPTASAQAFCSADSPTVADLVATGTGIQWYAASTGGTALAGTTALSTGTYYASQTVSSCESSRTSVSITVNTTPTAPTASAQAFCSADSPTVADLVATGTGIQWYAASTGGTALAGTTALSTGTYYASQTVSSCESSRTSVSVTVNTTPSAPTASAQAFCSADSPTVADLVATGTGIQWYAASTGGTALAGTTALSTGTYYASQTVSSCESSRTSVSVTVNTTPSAPTASAQAFCSADSPTVADLVATGTGIQWYAASTGGTALAGTTALSTGTYYASQTVSSCESSRTSVSITVNTTPTAPTASAQAFCSADSPTVADLVATGTGIQWYAASTGGTALAGTTALSTGTYYASQTVSSCESSRTSVSVTVNTTPTAPTASAQAFCSADSPTVADLVATGTGIQWYAASTGGTALAGTTALSTGTYYASQTVSSCESSRTSVSVTVNTTPTAPTASAQAFCSADSPTVADLVATGTGIQWYAASTGGTALAGTTALSTGTYYASQTVSSCESSRTSVSVTVNTTPTAPTASAQAFCSADSPTVADLVATGTGIQWYAASTGGTALAGTTALSTGTYYASQTVSSCESSRTSVSVTVNTTPTAPTASAQAFCSADSPTVADLVATGTGIQWYAASTGGTALAGTTALSTGTYYASQTVSSCESSRTSVSVTVNTTPSAPTASAQAFCSADSPTVADLVATGTGIQWYAASTGGTALAGTTALSTGTYYASQTVSSCESSRTSVSVTVNTTPSAPTASAQAFCSADSPTVADLVATGTGIQWYAASTGGTALAGTTALSTGTYYASQTVSSCESSRTSVSVTVNTTPTAPTASAQAFCSADSPTVADLVATGTGIQWYTASTGGIALAGTTALSTGTYYASQTVSSCESSRTSVSITVNTTPTAPTASAQAFCSADSPTVADLVATGTGIQWYAASTGGTALAGTTALSTGTYYASQTVSSCESSRTSVSVTVNTTPTAPTASAQAFCSADSPTVADLVATGTGIQWYAASTGGTALAGTTALSTGTYYASQTVSSCESSRTSVSITVNTTPTAPTASAQAFCSADSPTVADLVATGTGIQWYAASTGGTALAGTTVLSTGTYYASQTVSSCESSRTSVSVTVNTTPTAPTASAQAFCSADTPTVADLVATGTGIQWYAASTGGTALAGTTALSTGTYYASQTVSSCESSRTSVSVTVNTTPTAPTASAQAFCSADSPTVADLVATGTGIQWYAASTGGTALAGTTALSTGTYYASQTVSSCESSRTSVSVTVNTTPSAPTASAQAFCSADSPTVADLVATGTGIQWYAASTGGTALAGTTALSTGTYYASQTVSNCESSRTSVSVTVNTTPTAPTASAQAFCSADSPTVADLVATGTGIQWYAASTGGTALAGTTALSTGTYYASQTVSNCESSRTSVSVTVNTTPSAPTASAQAFCSADSPTVADLVATGTGIQWYAASTGGTALAGTTALSTGTYYASQTVSSCESSRTSVSVTVNTTPTAPTASAQAFCSADSPTVADLVATGTGIQWYAASTGGTALAGTTALSTGTYYASQTVSSCESSRTSVSVTVNTTPTAPTASAQAFCSADSPTVADLVATGTGIQWYAASTGGTALAGTTALSTGTYYASQTVSSCESSRTSVSVTVNTTPTAPTASAQAFCSADSPTVADLVATGTGIQWYTASTGGTALAGTTALSTGTYYASQTVSSCESSRTSVSITVNTTPTAPTASAQAFCSADSPTVADLVATGTGIQWYAASTGGTALAGTTALSTGTYYASQTVSSCESSRTSVSVTVNTTPTAPTASAQAFCSADSPTVADLVATGTGIQWYAASTGGTALAGTTALSTGTYYASQTVSSCESSRTSVSVTVNTTPSAPTASAQAFCSADSPTVADLVATGTGIQWYAASTGGTALAGTTALSTGTYYASQTVSSCESSRTSVSVTVNTTPSAPTASAQAFCSADSPTVADLVATGTGIQWYAASTGGTALAGTTALSTGTYYASQTVSSCESSRTSVSVTVNTTPTAPTASAQAFCSVDSPTVADLVATGTGIQWYAASTGGTALAGTTALSTGTYYASQTVSSCESSRTSVSVTVNTTPTAPTASAQAFCSADSPTVADLVATGTGIQWYAASTGGTALAGTTTLSTGTYYASQTVSSCESSRTSVSVTVNTTPSAPTASAQAFCSADSPTVADLVATGTGIQWYAASTGGTALAGTTALSTGTYYASQTVSSCESSRTSVSVTVNTTPSAPTASAQAFCSADSPTVADLVATGTGIQWYAASTGGTALGGTTALSTGTYYASQTVSSCESSRTSVSVTLNTTPTAPTASAQAFCSADSPTVADLVATGTGIQWYAASTGGTALAGTTALSTGTYYASQTVSSCESSRTSVSVTVNTTPSAPTASAQAFCSADSPTVADLVATGTGIQWYAASTGGTALAGTTALSTGTYYASQTVSSCESSRTSVSVTVNTTPSAPTASAQAFCSADSPTVADLVATGTGIQWYAASTGGTALAGTTALSTGTYYASQTVSNCESSRTSVSVIVNTTPSAPIASAQAFCSADSPTVADLVATGTGIQWYAASTGGTALAGTTALSTGTYYASQTVSSCESSRTSVSVTVNTTPTAPTASAQAFCSADSPTVADLVATGTGIQWYAASTGGTTLAGTTALSTGTYYASQTVSSCESSRTSVSVTVNTTPSAPTASAQAFCSADSPTVADLVATGTGIQWYAASTGGTALAGTTALSTGTYYASQTVSNCESSRTSVSVTVNTTPSAPIASAQAFCSADSPTVADLVATGTGIQWYAASTGGTALAGTTALSTGTYYASQTVSSCESSRTSVSVTVNTTPSAPTASAQVFCSADSPTVADLVATGTGIQWYAASTGGTALAGTTALSTGTYYASQTVSSCESTTRTMVNVTVTPVNTVSVASNSPTVPYNTVLPNITHTTTGATGIGTVTGLPAGVTASWSSNTITISGTPTVSGVFNYSIALTGGCGIANATGTITVTSVIDAVADDFTGTPITVGDSTSSVVANDTLDGNPVVIGTNPGEVTLTGLSVPTGLTLNPDGTITVNPGITAGNYTVTYQICENGAVPANCDSVTVNIRVDYDTDGDGIWNADDLDDDNDGILDSVEMAGDPNKDTDGDGIIDSLDLDSDGDGISDLVESGQDAANVDADGDGKLDSNVDADNDGIVDTADANDMDPNSGGSVTPVDTDGDGNDDYQDVDSDNDGVSDLVEGGSDGSLDADNDGVIDDQTDTDGDGIADSVDPDNGGTASDTPDTDGDGQPDYQDLDSDNDGLNDVDESGGTDADGDGQSDSGVLVDGDNLPDGDGDGTADVLDPNNPDLPGDLDTDGDGVIDDNTDSDGDGIADALDGDNGNFGDADMVDTDGDGIPDIHDLDDDNDGILDSVEMAGDPNKDTDGDGIIDSLDLDSDGDGISDLVESGQDAANVDADGDGKLDSNVDADNDGIVDTADANDNDTSAGGSVTPVDTDGDGNDDYQDVDSDNDGVSDLVEGGSDGNLDADNDGVIDDQTDTDGDGIADSVDPDNGGTAADTPDTDGDGQPDYQDLDSDNDGLNDVDESGGTDADGDGQSDSGVLVDGDNLPDGDGDGTADVLDPNNPDLPGDLDTDGDGVIDDNTDSDGDGIADALDGDNGNFGDADMVDTDGDGIPDIHDLDDDNDGILDSVEMAGDPNKDTDGDGIIDSLDLDSDGDGISDLVESGQDAANVDADGDGKLDSNVDADNDGIVDTADANDNDTSAGGSVTPVDTDGDGNDDYQDVDSDNDGVSDLVEGGSDGSLDADNDGVIDDQTDTDGDGIADSVDPDNGGTASDTPDTDGDGQPDYQDLDSDNDGLNDVDESGGTDADGDGQSDSGVLVDGDNLPDGDGDGTADVLDPNNPDLPGDLDTDGDGVIDDNTDSDGDGIADALDGDNGNFGDADMVDTDGDGIPDVLDLDDDNDGILDSVEMAGDPNKDTDGDGIIDSLDLDSDGDGISDLVESGQDAANVDADGDGKLDSNVDADNDGIVDTADANDNDTSAGGSVTPVDTDGDGNDDYQDVDSDNDGVSDLVEGGSDGSLDADNDGMIDDQTDTDGDGIADSVDPDNGGTAADTPDTDGDGQPDYQDLDSDNDGINDVEESGGTDADGDGQSDSGVLVDGDNLPDGDGDGTADVLDPNNPDLPGDLDTDGDGVIDDNTDSDGDGIADALDGDNGNFGDAVLPDTDGDGIPDIHDLDDDNDGILDSVEMAGDPNKDTDGDGIIDSLDLDSDGDGIPDLVESGQDAANVDADGDGKLDSNVDADNDGIVDTADANDNDTNAGGSVTPVDTDGDGNDDYQDLDSDNDGISDLSEGGSNSLLDSNNDGILDNPSDTDGDGIADSVDADNGGTPADVPDTDGDGQPDYQDVDSDDDGINDLEEGGSDSTLDSDGDGMIDDTTDADGDGMADAVDPDNGGSPADTPDTDGDGAADYQDVDDDGDGVLTEEEDVDADGNPSDDDTDGDGTPDYLDTDDDGDGIATEDEHPDDDGDGIPLDALDTDEDGTPDYLDPDTLSCLTIYNEFSPNQDGNNDTFVISCIGEEKYKNNRLEIFNRWGNLVYSKNRYDNSWDGTSNGRLNVQVDDKLPSGTYYYVLDLGDGSKPKVGWIYINRD